MRLHVDDRAQGALTSRGEKLPTSCDPRHLVSTGALLAVAVLLLSGCRSSGLDVHLVRSATAKPGNVAVYFRVDRSDGTPVGGLKAENFKNLRRRPSHLGVREQTDDLEPDRRRFALHALARRHERQHFQIGAGAGGGRCCERVYGEGREVPEGGGLRLRRQHESLPHRPFTSSGAPPKAGSKSLATFKPKDPSTNLHGAVAKGLETLKSELAHAEHPLRFGTLVVFTDGTDHAGRVSRDDMMKAVNESEYDIFAIGLGAEISERGDRRDRSKRHRHGEKSRGSQTSVRPDRPEDSGLFGTVLSPCPTAPPPAPANTTCAWRRRRRRTRASDRAT